MCTLQVNTFENGLGTMDAITIYYRLLGTCMMKLIQLRNNLQRAVDEIYHDVFNLIYINVSDATHGR